MKGLDINDLPPALRKQAIQQLAGQIDLPGPAAHLEPRPRHAPARAQAPAGPDGSYRLCVVEHRHRLADPDGACCKYLLDALVSCGVLPDDSPRWIAGIEKSQVKVGRDAPEKTVVEVWVDTRDPMSR